MSAGEVTGAEKVPANRQVDFDFARLFYSGAAGVLIILVVWGFHHFYLEGRAYPGRELTPPIRTLVISHGIAMAVWMLLMLAQPMLIVFGNRRVHMTMGKVGAALAALIVVLGFKLGVESVRVAPPGAVIWGLTAKQFMAVPVMSIVIFGGLVAAGIAHRRRPAIHRALMLLATLSALSAAVSRIDAVSNLYVGTVWAQLFGPFFSTLVLALILLGVRSLLTRSLDRYLAVGCAGLIFASAFIVQVAKTGAWDSLAGFLLG